MSDEKIKQYLLQYENQDATRQDILKARKMYRGLNYVQELYTFTNGTKKNLVKLIGTIPVSFKGKIYHIPICIWLMDTHPKNAPICYVNPTPDMCLKPSFHVDHSGKIYLPYLHEWSANKSNLVELILVMIEKFGFSPPVYAKPRQGLETSTQMSTPYPTQSYTNVISNPSVTSPYLGSGGTSSAYPPGYPIHNNIYPPTYPPGFPTHNNVVYPPTYPPGFPTHNNVYPPTSNVSPPYPPAQNSNLPYPPHPSTQPNLTSSPSSVSSSPSNTGTITNEHIRASLMSAVEDKIRRKINEQTALCRDEIEILLQTQLELNQGKNKLDNMFENLEKEKKSITQKIQILKEKEIELEKAIEKLSVEEDNMNVDDAVVTTTPLYRQILNTHCEDAATEDTIYYIGEALRRGIIDLDVFIKQCRALSRKRLMLRSLLEKCRIKAGLSVH